MDKLYIKDLDKFVLQYLPLSAEQKAQFYREVMDGYNARDQQALRHGLSSDCRLFKEVMQDWPARESEAIDMVLSKEKKEIVYELSAVDCDKKESECVCDCTSECDKPLPELLSEVQIDPLSESLSKTP